MEQRLKYISYSVVCEEVPDEISLVINISGCPHKCEGCHSKYLWNYTGQYISDNIDAILNIYSDYITCVCFMGGDQNIDELFMLCKKIKNRYKLKTCVYSGLDDIHVFDRHMNKKLIDYLKIGRYIQELGGLDSDKTNQRMYRISDGSIEDITYRMNNNE